MMRPEEDERAGAVAAGTEFLANEGGDTGLMGAIMVEGSGWMSVDVGESFEGFMADWQEAGGTRDIKDDGGGTLISRGTPGKTTGCGRGSRETGDRVVDRS